MPNLVIIFGPPASGKAAIGQALAGLTGFRLFHNHMTAEPAAALFGWGNSDYSESVTQIRLALFSRVAQNKALPNIVFTFVWAFGVAEDDGFIRDVVDLFETQGEKVYFVELLASLEARIAREGTPLRLALKPSKRDVEAARARHRQLYGQFTLNSLGEFPYPERHIVIDTEMQDALGSAQAICKHFGFVTQ
jgi:hypothetical protein